MIRTMGQWREEVAARLRDIPGLHVYARWPDGVNVPALIVMPDRSEQVTFDSGRTLHFMLLLLVWSGEREAERGQRLLDDFLDGDGARSIQEAVEDGQVRIDPGWQNYGLQSRAGAVTDWWGVEVPCTIED
jgi:hypothetical protein